MHHLSRKDLALGAVYCGFGIVYGGIALGELPLGTPLNMGPGFFPVVLAGILFCIGIAVTFRGAFMEIAAEPFGTVAWRGLAAILSATVVFAVTIHGLGLPLAIAATVLVASLASTRTRPTGAIVTALVLSLLSTGVFIYGLRLPIPLWGSWLN